MRLYRDPAVPGRLDFDHGLYERIASERGRRLTHSHTVPIRSGYAWPVAAGSVVRLLTVEGPQVCDLNLWNLNNPRERFWAARTRQIQGAHVTTFDRLWSCLPYLRPMATITNDTLPTTPTANGGRCHDLLGSRCDPYLYKLLDDRDYDVTCHNNLTRAVAPYHLTELDVHDVLVMPTVGAVADPIPRYPRPLSRRITQEPTPQYTWLANLHGGPAISVPCGLTASGLPAGLQLLGRRGDDATVLRAAGGYETVSAWRRAGAHPPLWP